jgi:hypothetical protein
MSSQILILGSILHRFSADYRSTRAAGTFTHVPFSLTLSMRPVCLLPGPGVLLELENAA